STIQLARVIYTKYRMHSTMTKKSTSFGILGGDKSGLATAYYLQKKGCTATVYEQADSVGGAIKTTHSGDWLVEEGPNTLMVKSHRMWQLLEELNLDAKIVEANSLAKRRYIVKNNQPVPLPDSVLSLLRTPLFSSAAKLRLLKEPFIAASDEEDESIASFIGRRLGKDPLDYAVIPFVSGVYAGSPDEFSVEHTFSALWKLEQQYGSLFKGLL